MPIEIRELVIKATVTQENSQGNSIAAASSNNEVSQKEEVVKICVEKVLEILKEKYER